MRLDAFNCILPRDTAAARALAALDWPGEGGSTATRERLEELLTQGAAFQDATPALWAYRIRRKGTRDALGLVGRIDSSALDTRPAIVPHEETLHETVHVRTLHLAKTSLQTGPVLLACRDNCTYGAWRLLARHIRDKTPALIVRSNQRDDALWRIAPDDATELLEMLGGVERACVVDGHHRCAASMRLGSPMLVALFPAAFFSVGACWRIATVGTQSTKTLAACLRRTGFEVKPSRGDAPAYRHAAFLSAGIWHDVNLSRAPGESLSSDARLLQDRVLGPYLGIADPSCDQRLCSEPPFSTDDVLRKANPTKVIFRLHPATVTEVLNMADAGLLMPPKTTWFEPKPLLGLFSCRS